MPRLFKITKELNIGFETAKDFLESKYGIHIISPNSNITEEQCADMRSHFSNDKYVHNIALKHKNKSAFSEEELNFIKDDRPSIRLKKASKLTKKPQSSYNKGFFGKMFGYVRFVKVPFGGFKKK